MRFPLFWLTLLLKSATEYTNHSGVTRKKKGTHMEVATPRKSDIFVRIPIETHKLCKAAASMAGMNLQDWLPLALDVAAREELKAHGLSSKQG
jgi:hypothetical protein